jgi:ankyrin repeat protein
MILNIKRYMLLVSIFFVVTNVYSYQGFLHQDTISPRILVNGGLKSKCNTEHYTVFSRAMVNNKVEVVQKLLETKAINVPMVLDAIAKEHNMVMLEQLLQKGCIKGDCKLICNGKKVSLVDFVISQNASLSNLPDSMVVSMVKNGASINNLIGDERVTPLFKALQTKNVPLFETLLTNGADPASKNKDGNSVLTHLKNNSNTSEEFCSALVSHGFDMQKAALTKRGRKFTVARKKMKHSWGKSMMAQSFN